ncbi:MAG: hypothetical protein ACYDH1_07405 [Anaerolineaceae bacterium]
MDKSRSIANRIPVQIWVILILLNIGLILSVLNSEILKSSGNPVQASQITSTPTISPSPTNSSTSIPKPIEQKIVGNPDRSYLGENLYFFSSNPTGKYQIYVFAPGILPITKLFDDDFEKIQPSVNPENNKIAYSARKNGYWDLYIYDLSNNSEIRITDTPEYEGNPTWSPDGLFIAYESYKNGNLDIFIKSLEEMDLAPIQLTNSIEADYSPAWSPSGREIAFVSTQSGEDEIWIALLDNVENRFTNISKSPSKSDQHPAWSTDGSYLIWSSDVNGYPLLQKYDLSSQTMNLHQFSEGSFPIWNEDQIYYIQLGANSNYLTSRNSKNNSVDLASTLIPGQVNGFSLLKLSSIHDQMISELSNSFEKQLSQESFSSQNLANENKITLQQLSEIEAPYPYLLNVVTDSFTKLRKRVSEEVGWDFLNSLEKAYTPITDPTNPGNDQDWIFTGRAFEFNPLTLYAGLGIIVREERDGLIFWRVYLKTRYQDGSQGLPMTQLPWQLDTRFSNDAATYETGGNRISLPDGYWVDFTSIALSLGWERQPALTNWKTYYSNARFNQFVFTNGLDWITAMNEIYPIEALRSPTSLPSATITPSITPTTRYFRSVTPTISPTETLVPTRRPTWTQSP